MIEPLWQRALDARRRELMIASMKPGKKHALGMRKSTVVYPVGYAFGHIRIVGPPERGFRGRWDARYPVECAVCGLKREMFLSNLRKHSGRCVAPKPKHP